MKKLTSVMLIFAIFLMCNFFTVSALENGSTSIEYLPDGSYFITVVQMDEGTRGTVSGYKDTNYYSASGTLQWRFRLHGTFTYTGTSATCTSHAHVTTVYNDNWQVNSQTSSKSGRKATGNVTMKYYLLGIPTDTIQRTSTLSCDNNGNLT